jgi:hypothetical protein
MEYFEEDVEQPAPIEPGSTLVLAISTTLLGVVFLLLLISDQVAAGL